jgi:hypothetical protein
MHDVEDALAYPADTVAETLSNERATRFSPTRGNLLRGNEGFLARFLARRAQDSLGHRT